MSFEFWRKWLLVACLLQAFGGLAMALAIHTPLFAWYTGPVSRGFWHTETVPPLVEPFYRWIFAVLGATIAGWGVAVAALAHGPLRRRDPWAWKGAVLSLLAWFPVDTAMSLHFGVTVNAVFNVVLLAMVALPLAFLRRGVIESRD